MSAFLVENYCRDASFACCRRSGGWIHAGLAILLALSGLVVLWAKPTSVVGLGWLGATHCCDKIGMPERTEELCPSACFKSVLIGYNTPDVYFVGSIPNAINFLFRKWPNIRQIQSQLSVWKNGWLPENHSRSSMRRFFQVIVENSEIENRLCSKRWGQSMILNNAMNSDWNTWSIDKGPNRDGHKGYIRAQLSFTRLLSELNGARRRIGSYFRRFRSGSTVLNLSSQCIKTSQRYPNTTGTDTDQRPLRPVKFARSTLYPNLTRLLTGLTCFFFGSWCAYTAAWGWSWRGSWGLVFLLIGCALCFGPIPWCGCDDSPCLFRLWK
jgi:hypothetical protein